MRGSGRVGRGASGRCASSDIKATAPQGPEEPRAACRGRRPGRFGCGACPAGHFRSAARSAPRDPLGPVQVRR